MKPFPCLVLAAALLPAIGLAQTEVQAEKKSPSTASTNIIYACVTDFADFARIVKAPKDCRKDEKLVEWNIKGIAGPEGSAGPQGPIGLPGLTGAKGTAGVAGAKGATGATGPAGPTGVAGPAGATGANGSAGPAGVAGAAGPTGPAGVAGPAGTAGAKGATGANGPIGPAGPLGPAGVQGPTGPTGPAGATGPQGTPGSTTLPAPLQALSTLLTLKANQQFNAQFLDGNGGTCTLGDIVLSTNRYFGGNFEPADGALYQISSNTAVFSILGTRFGGDGVKTFGVPNLSAAAPSGLYYSICFQGIFPPRL